MPISWQIPDTYQEVEATFGKFSYTDVGTDGAILIDKGWTSKHIVTVRDMPGCNGMAIHCHTLIVDPLREALTVAVKARPDYKIRRIASFVARHKLHNPGKPLSLHSWGIAIDINSDTNAYGASTYSPVVSNPRTDYDIPSAFVDAFEATGALWGGHFKFASDPMHFQWAYRI